jgi:uncharacterized protein (TIGR03086 family)
VDSVEGLLESLEALASLVGSANRSDLASPSRCPGWTRWDVLGHSIAVTLRFAQFASGETDRPELPRSDLVGIDPAGSLRAALATAEQAWVSTDRSRVCHLSFGDFDAEEAAGINLVDVLAHGWDITPIHDRWFESGDELWRMGLVAARGLIGTHRDLRHYGPEVIADSDATIQQRFLAYLGRS